MCLLKGEIITELLPIMKRECSKMQPTPENAMSWFLERVKTNLHVVLCFSPVGEKFRSRALKFPGLISGCTINWFQPWPKEALVSILLFPVIVFPPVIAFFFFFFSWSYIGYSCSSSYFDFFMFLLFLLHILLILFHSTLFR